MSSGRVDVFRTIIIIGAKHSLADDGESLDAPSSSENLFETPLTRAYAIERSSPERPGFRHRIIFNIEVRFLPVDEARQRLIAGKKLGAGE